MAESESEKCLAIHLLVLTHFRLPAILKFVIVLLRVNAAAVL